MKAPKEVAHITALYDYVGDEPALELLESADEAFLELENEFQSIRSWLINRRFRNWHKKLGFLLRYMQMIRVRSPLFFQQKEIEGSALDTWVIDKVHDDGKTLTLRSMEPIPPPAAFIKNQAIRHMQEEIQNNGAWMWDFNWALRYCESVDEPFVTSEAPLVVEGSAADIETAIKHPDSLLIFPLCWQACLFGSLCRFDKGTDKFGLEDMRIFRSKYRRFAEVFLLSPTKLDDITNVAESQPQAKAAGAP
jgi:hypothetical protein